jgi:hypothetical protein
MIVGSIVTKIKGKDKGETGVVKEINVGAAGEGVRVVPTNSALKWNIQSKGNFSLLNKEGDIKIVDSEDEVCVEEKSEKEKWSRKGEKKVKISLTKGVKKKSNGMDHSGNEVACRVTEKTDEILMDDSSREFHVGDHVKKVSGKDNGETGVVERVYDTDDDGKMKVKVTPDDSTCRWGKQAISNFVLLGNNNGHRRHTINKEHAPVRANNVAIDNHGEGEIRTLVNDLTCLKLSTNGSELQWNASEDVAFPPEFTKKTIVELPLTLSNGRVVWNGREFTKEKWTECLTMWDLKYPNISVKKGKITHTTHESSSFRCTQTTNQATIKFCWDSLPHTHRCIPSKLMDRFRVDMYGNVVSIEASDSAVCKFDVDHLFPWSRGGRSVHSNFVACQWDANRRVKSNTLIQALRAEEMACGLSPEQFAALMAHVEIIGKASRRDKAWAKDKVERWLLCGPRKGFALSNFRSQVNNTTDGSMLWEFFSANEAAQDNAGVSGEISTMTENMALVNIASAVPPPVPEQPCIYMRQTDARLECFGKQTYQIKTVLLRIGE